MLVAPAAWETLRPWLEDRKGIAVFENADHRDPPPRSRCRLVSVYRAETASSEAPRVRGTTAPPDTRSHRRQGL
jgi:hypothetical protein